MGIHNTPISARQTAERIASRRYKPIITKLKTTPTQIPQREPVATSAMLSKAIQTQRVDGAIRKAKTGTIAQRISALR